MGYIVGYGSAAPLLKVVGPRTNVEVLSVLGS